MATVTRRIGLSLGADLCWPACYEAILRKLDPAIPVGNDLVKIHVERVPIEPFDLRGKVPYDLVIDRLTHWYPTRREWIKKGILMDDLYVFNNPWAVQAMEKHTSYCAMMKLGFPIPDTWMTPPKSYDETADLAPTLNRYAKLFDLGEIGKKVGYPLFMKPYDGGAWVGVTRIANEQSLRDAYEQSGKRVMHIQNAVDPFDRFVRAIGIGPQVYTILYDPSAPLHGRYTCAKNFLSSDEAQVLSDYALTINAFFGWDFNSCEALHKEGVWHPIDFANPCPDSQVTSLHYHFPWFVKSKIRWSVFCAATKRKFRKNPDWEPYFEIGNQDKPFREKLSQYASLARKHFDYDRFQDFCAQNLSILDEAAWEFFGTNEAKDAIRIKVAALYPAHEIEEFTEKFWSLIQEWRSDTSKGEAR